MFLYYISNRAVTINNCGDMACDSRNKNHIIDLDGTLFGGGSGGSLIPDSAHDWAPHPDKETSNINPIYGLGYYRVPRELKTTLEGEMIQETDLITQRGRFCVVHALAESIVIFIEIKGI